MRARPDLLLQWIGKNKLSIQTRCNLRCVQCFPFTLDFITCLLQSCLFTPPHSVFYKNGSDHSFNITQWLWWMYRFSTCAFFFLWLRYKQEVDMLKSTCCHSKYHPIPVPAALSWLLCAVLHSLAYFVVFPPSVGLVSLYIVWSLLNYFSCFTRTKRSEVH